MVLSGEGQLDVLDVAGLHANNAILEAGDEGAGAQLQAVVLCGAACEGNIVLQADIVDDSGVAQLSCAVHGDQLGSTVHEDLQLLVNSSLGDGGQDLVCLQALVLLQGDFGANGDQSLEGEAFLAQGQDLDLGGSHVVQALLSDGCVASLGVDQLQSLFVEDACAVHALDDLTGSLALTEAGDVDAAAVLQVNLVQASLKLLSGNFHDEFDFVLFLVFNNALDNHVDFPPVNTLPIMQKAR